MSVLRMLDVPTKFKTTEEYLLWRIGVLEAENYDLKREVNTLLAKKALFETVQNLGEEIKKECGV